jgi:hypothetical protein
MSAMLDRYSEQQAAFWIDGYFSVKPGQTPEEAAVEAKAELIKRFQKHIEHIEAFTVERFLEMKAKGI